MGDGGASDGDAPVRPPSQYSTVVQVPTPEVEEMYVPGSASRLRLGESVSMPPQQREPTAPTTSSTPAKPLLTRGQSLLQQSARFLGLSIDMDVPPEQQTEECNMQSRLRHLNKRYKLKDDEVRQRVESVSTLAGSMPPTPSTSHSVYRVNTGLEHPTTVYQWSPPQSSASMAEGGRGMGERRMSALSLIRIMGSSLVTRGTLSPVVRGRSMGRASFVPEELAGDEQVEEEEQRERERDVRDDEEARAPVVSQSRDGGDIVEMKELSRPTRLFGPAHAPRLKLFQLSARSFNQHVAGTPEEGRGEEERERLARLRESSMRVGGGAPAGAGTRRGSLHRQLSRQVSSDEVFFDVHTPQPTPVSAIATGHAKFGLPSQSPLQAPAHLFGIPEREEEEEAEGVEREQSETDPLRAHDASAPKALPARRATHVDRSLEFGDARLAAARPTTLGGSVPVRDSTPDRPCTDGWMDVAAGAARNEIFMEQIGRTIKASLPAQRGARRRRGVGAFGELCQRKQKEGLSAAVRRQLERGEDKRPYFTWWVTVVQAVVALLAVASHGIGKWGVERYETTVEVMHTSMTLRQISFYEQSNMWIGPRYADLVRLGAKYSPCMRQERNIMRLLARDRDEETRTGCCVRNDGSGCFQTGEENCPKLIATLHKWGVGRGEEKEAHGRTNGAVCGQDPEYCLVPQSVEPNLWPDNLTQWPTCEQSRVRGVHLPSHMSCEITGRPCCMQMQGRCRIATREYCDAVRGFYHENATLCSQVNCLSDVCGMLPFLSKDHPNQAYRLVLSLFLHAGIGHFLVSAVVQLWLMRDLEMLIGWKRMGLLYILSGVGGNLASAIFVPFNPEVGPSGSQMGIMAALMVDAYHHRRLLQEPLRAFMHHVVVVAVLLLIGLLPWVDNWAHAFGFIFGFFITTATFPYLDFANDKIAIDVRRERVRRQAIVLVSGIIVVALFVLLGSLFFNNVEISCEWCSLLNCITPPWMDEQTAHHYCDNQGLELQSWLPI